MNLTAKKGNALISEGQQYKVNIMSDKYGNLFYRIHTGKEFCPFFDINEKNFMWYFSDPDPDWYDVFDDFDGGIQI